MSEESGAERTEEATPRKRERARNEGSVARSQEVLSALSMFVFLAAVLWWFAHVVPGLVSHMQNAFEFRGFRAMEDGSGIASLRVMVLGALEVAMPVAGLAAILGVAGNIAQVGFSVNWELATPRWDRLNPTNWLKRMASIELPVGLLKSLIKGLVVIAVAAYGLRDEPALLWRLAFASIETVGDHMRSMALTVAWRVTALMGVIALADYLWARFRHDRELRMSRQELKDEMKEAEGSPQLRAHMRRRARERVKERLVQSVKSATVVAMNPTHFAVALRYERDKDPTPRVVAKGRGHKALRIRDIALANGIPVVQDKPLARALYGSIKVGQIIPVDLYRSVARLLAAVYKQKGLRVRASK